jgi:hypothetical protein
MRIEGTASKALHAAVHRRGASGLSTRRPNPGQAARAVGGDDRANPAARAVVPVGPRREHEHPGRFAALAAFAPFLTQLLASPRPLEQPRRAPMPADAYHAAADRLIRDLRGARVDQLA